MGIVVTGGEVRSGNAIRVELPEGAAEVGNDLGMEWSRLPKKHLVSREL